jgi:CDP-glucose 4,6-dehydratase
MWEPSPEFWRHRGVAVTGATGLLGSHLVAALVRLDAAVAVLVRDRTPTSPVSSGWATAVSVVEGPIEDQAVCERLLGEYGVSVVFHLAAQTQVGVANTNAVSTFEANVRGTWSLLEAARRAPAVRAVVVASSDKAYGAQPQLPYDEDMPLRAIYPYDVSKACSDLIAQSYAATWGVPAVVTRCGNFFGPGDTNWQRLVPGTIRALLEGERPQIRSDGRSTRDYLYVEDATLAYLCLGEAMTASEGLRGQAFNFSNERPISVLDLVELIEKAADTSVEPVVLGSAQHEIDSQWLSSAKARRILGWAPHYELEDALRITVDWYRNYFRSMSH